MPIRLQYRPALRSLLLCLLITLAVSTCSAAQTPTIYDLQLQQIQSDFPHASGVAHQAVLLERAYNLRDFVSSPGTLDSWLRQLSEDAQLSSEIKAEVARYRATTERHLGNAKIVLVDRSEVILAAAVQAAEAHPDSATTLEDLGLLEGATRPAQAREHLEHAVALEPTTDRWLEISRLCPNELCRFSALQRANQLASKSSADDARIVALSTAEYYTSRGQADKAYDLLEPVVASSTTDFVARKKLADICSSRGENARALAAYRKLAAEFPQPIWLRRELASSFEDLGLLDRASVLAEAAFALNRDGNAEQSLVLRIEEKRRDSDALRRAYQFIAAFEPDNAQVLAKLAALSFDNGEQTAAERELDSALQQKPDDPRLRQQYSDVLAATGNTTKARAELSRALLNNPGDDGLRLRVVWHDARQKATDPDAAYLAKFSELKRSAPGQSAANAIMLSDVRIDRLRANGLFSSRVQQFFLVQTPQGARDFRSRNVQYSPASESLQVIRARVHKSDGRTLEGEDGGEAPVADLSVAMYYDVRSRTLRFPSVDPGDIVELDYRTTPVAETNPYGDYFGNLLMFRTSMPTAHKRYVLVTPPSRKLYVREVRMPSAAVLNETATERTYQWDSRDIAALPNEPRGPAATSFAPYLHISTFANFNELGLWYAELLKPQLELDSTLRDIAAKIARENSDELSRIHAVHQLVLRNTHYVALEFGVYSYKPYPVSRTYARRFGDCKDKASLMIALLRAVGVEADLAFVRTRRMGDIDENAASVAPFNHAIVYLPKYQLWLDGTAEYAGARELPLDDQGATALTVSVDGEAVLRHIPVTSVDDNVTRRTLRAELRHDGTIEFSGDTYTRGEDAPGLRREYEVPERQQDAVRQPLADLFPNVRLEKVEVHSELEQDVNVSFRGVLDTFAGKSTVVLNNSWMSRKYLANLAPLGSRTQDLLLPAPWSTQEEIRIALPMGAQAISIPNDVRLDTNFGSAQVTYQQRGRDIVVRNNVQFRQLRISPPEYSSFREFCSQVERAFRQEVKVSLR